MSSSRRSDVAVAAGPESPAWNQGIQSPDSEGIRWLYCPKPSVPEDEVACTLTYMEENYVGVTQDGLLKKQMVHSGNGLQLFEGSFMKIHYRVFAFDTEEKLCKEPFDSSWDREYEDGTVAIPKHYCLMEGEVMDVLDIGVATMTVGEVANFLAHETYAYGNFGLPGIVEANAPVFVQVVVLQALEPTTVQKILHGVVRHKSKASFDDIYEVGMEYRKKGNAEYCIGRWRLALSLYKRGFTWIQGIVTLLPSDVQRFFNLSLNLLNQMATCSLLLKQFENVIKYSRMALMLKDKLEDKPLGKLYYRQALAQFEIKKDDEARDSISKAVELLPRDPDVVQLHLYAKLREIGDKQRRKLENMWKRIETSCFQRRSHIG